MTLPIKGSRKIVVGFHDLRWRFVRRSTGLQALLVVQGLGKGQLIVHGPLSPERGRVLADGEIVKPSVVTKWVNAALANGWNPSGDTEMTIDHQDWPYW